MRALKAILGHPALVWACRLVVGGLFILSSFGKLADMAKFLGSVEQYQMLPALPQALWAASLPGIELLAGLLLIFGPWWRASALLIAGLFGVFIVALVSVIARRMEIDCSCMDIIGSWAGTFGTSAWLNARAPRLAALLTRWASGPSLVSWHTVLRDVYFLIPTLVVVFAPRKDSPETGAGR